MVRIPSLSRRQETVPTQDENADGRIDGRDARSKSGAFPASGTDPVVTDRSQDRATYRGRNTGSAGAAPEVDGSRTDIRTAGQRRAATAGTGRPMPESERLVAARRDTAGTPDLEETVDVNPTTATDGRGPVGRRSGTGHRRDVGRAVADRTDTDRTDTDLDEPAVVAPAGPRPRASLLATVSLILGVAGALFVLTGTLAGYGIALGALGALLGVAGLGATRRRHVAGKSDALIGLVLGLSTVVAGILAMTGQFDWPNTDGDNLQRFREWLDSQFADRF